MKKDFKSKAVSTFKRFKKVLTRLEELLSAKETTTFKETIFVSH